MDKLISVVIPTFNRKELTDNAVQSVVSSCPELLEIIVVDDCGTIPYSYEMAVNASGIPVQVVSLQANVGAGLARKAGVAKASGKFIAFLDSDDSYDQGWMDYAVSELQPYRQMQNLRPMLSGITNGERRAGAVIRKALAAMPAAVQLAAARVVTTLFNPFYMPSLILHKDICFFKDGLRHCEDYYSTAVAVFHADRICLPQVVACHLGREPNSAGGESAAREKMYRGEMEVRRALIRLSSVPPRYKPMLPVGMLYQVVRSGMKRFAARGKSRG